MTPGIELLIGALGGLAIAFFILWLTERHERKYHEGQADDYRKNYHRVITENLKKERLAR